MFIEYILIFKYLFFCFGLSALLFFISFIFVFQTPNAEKMSVYECGFSPFGDSRSRFEMSFYMVAMLFMMFDLEMVFLFPWMMMMNYTMNFFVFISMMIFLIMLAMGFVYEWMKGALDWQ